MHAHVVALREGACPGSSHSLHRLRTVLLLTLSFGLWTTWLHVVTMFVVRTARVYSECREPCVSDSQSQCVRVFFRLSCTCNCVKSCVSPALSPQAELQFLFERERVGAVIHNTRQRHKDKHRSHTVSVTQVSLRERSVRVKTRACTHAQDHTHTPQCMSLGRLAQSHTRRLRLLSSVVGPAPPRCQDRDVPP